MGFPLILVLTVPHVNVGTYVCFTFAFQTMVPPPTADPDADFKTYEVEAMNWNVSVWQQATNVLISLATEMLFRLSVEHVQVSVQRIVIPSYSFFNLMCALLQSLGILQAASE